MGTLNISFDQIRALRIAVPPEAQQRWIERHARRAQRVHRTAVSGRKTGGVQRARQALAAAIDQTEQALFGGNQRMT